MSARRRRKSRSSGEAGASAQWPSSRGRSAAHEVAAWKAANTSVASCAPQQRRSACARAPRAAGGARLAAIGVNHHAARVRRPPPAHVIHAAPDDKPTVVRRGVLRHLGGRVAAEDNTREGTRQPPSRAWGQRGVAPRAPGAHLRLGGPELEARHLRAAVGHDKVSEGRAPRTTRYLPPNGAPRARERQRLPPFSLRRGA